MRDICVLITCCNGIISPGQISCLRDIDERSVRIVGVDASEFGYGSRMVDCFRKVPRANDPGYVQILLSICEEERVDVVLVANDAEFFLSEYKQEFLERGTQLALNDSDLLVSVDDKASFFRLLQKKGLPTPKFHVPANPEEFEEACHDLGYPENPVVAKPRRGGGSRGVRIIRPGLSKQKILLGKLGNQDITFEDMCAGLSEGDVFPSIVVMEYLPGIEYSVDSLVDQGEALIIVPKTRDVSEPGRSLVARVDCNEEVVEAVSTICRELDLHYNINIQFKRGSDGILYPYELNPRIAATIAACRAAGANLLYFGVKLALGEEIPPVSIHNGMRMIRYYQEYYEFPEEKC
ncbi:MAG: ATP-grasp domain-containing protein [Bdellovibrionales bacterium]|nr:ATP-grasp domain-containing protein [Bdellovibrionales bacterium]